MKLFGNGHATFLSWVTAVSLAVVPGNASEQPYHGGSNGHSHRETMVTSSTEMLMGGTVVEFLNGMVGFGDISKSQEAVIVSAIDGLQNEQSETIRHDQSGSSNATLPQSDALREYIDSEVSAGEISEDTKNYLTGLLGLNRNSDTGSLSNTSVPAVYSGNGNVELLGTFDPEEGEEIKHYNGIWGVRVGGREYALQCSLQGLHIVDVSDAANPFRVQFIAMSGGYFWRDANVHTDPTSGITYAYVAGQGGIDPALFVISLEALLGSTAPGPDSNPIPEDDIANRGYLYWGHTLNVENGNLFLNSASGFSGCLIFDLFEDPFFPSEITTYEGSGRDCHDSLQRNDVDVDGSPRDLLYVADGFSRRFRVLDITDIRSDADTVLLGETDDAPGIYAHSVALSEDQKTLYTFEEKAVYSMGVYDISDPSSILQIHNFTWSGDQTIARATVHNGHIRGNYLLTAYYEAGLRVFDVSNPRNPLEVGQYDTWGGNITAGFNGAWNLHPYLPSGNVLLSDTKSGLFIFRINPVPLPETPTSLTATAISSLSGVALAWADVTGASGYTVQRGVARGGPYNTVLATNIVGTSYTDTMVSAGETYYYVVVATNAEGASPASTEVVFGESTEPELPKTPTNLVVADLTSSSVTLDWAPAVSATGYTVLRGLGSGGPYSTVLATNLVGTTYTDTPVEEGGTYYYVVIATNVKGESPASSEIVVQVPLPFTGAPVSVAPVTSAPVSEAPVTSAPVTEAPATSAPVTATPVTSAPLSEAPTTFAPITEAPIATSSPVTEAPVTSAPVTEAPISSAPTMNVPVTSAPMTEAPVTAEPFTSTPVTVAPFTDAPTTNMPVADKAPIDLTITPAPITGAPITPAPIPTTISPTQTSQSPVTSAPATDPPQTSTSPKTSPPESSPPIDPNETVSSTCSQLWWERTKAAFVGINLKRCGKREFPPENGSFCAVNAKTCFFGCQQCLSVTGVASYPEVRCFCNGNGREMGTWACETTMCPTIGIE